MLVSNYPNSIDDNTTLPPASGNDATSVNANIDATIAIENALGIVPGGAYATVRTRLDILEARINNPFAPAPNTINPFFIGNTGVTIQTGFGDPNVLDVLAISGSLYLREDGYIQNTLYVFSTDGYWHPVELNLNGAVVVSTRTITSNYVVDSISPDYTIFCNASSPISITLPTTMAGRQLIIKDISGGGATNHITILPFGSQQIDGTGNFVITTNRGSITIIGDGVSGWWIT